MPKIRDLGINVIPETMRPPEIGPGGGGGGGCNAGTYGPNCPTTTFPTTPNCPGTTFPTTPWYGGGGNCPTTTFPPTTTGPQQPYMMEPGCPGTTFVQLSLGCQPHGQVAAYAQAGCPTTTFPRQSENCYGKPELTREAIAQLKQQLQQQIAQLDEYAKSIGPKTPEEIDAREKQLRAELEDLARRRKEYEP